MKALQPFLKPLLLLGLALIGVVVVSWIVFPDWQTQPGGFWKLLGVAAVAVIALAGGLLGVLKTWRELQSPGKSKAPAPRSRQDQSMNGSPDGEQSMKHSGGDQSQKMSDSPRGKQRME